MCNPRKMKTKPLLPYLLNICKELFHGTMYRMFLITVFVFSEIPSNLHPKTDISHPIFLINGGTSPTKSIGRYINRQRRKSLCREGFLLPLALPNIETLSAKKFYCSLLVTIFVFLRAGISELFQSWKFFNRHGNTMLTLRLAVKGAKFAHTSEPYFPVPQVI